MGASRERVLAHACCGPCTVYPLDALRAEGFEVMLYFHNPNIQPFREYRKRLESMRRLAEQRDAPLIVRDEYDPEAWLRDVAFREDRRCLICYTKRLESAARVARRGGYDAFTTTLLYSKRQKHELLRELAEAVAEEAGTRFLYRDFRKGWKAGIESSREMGLYRQEYCGCLFSERDRFKGNGGRAESGKGPKT